MTTDDLLADFGRGEIKRERATPPGFKDWTGGPITEPGAYLGVPNAVYHGGEICAAPSVSATGLKVLGGAKGARTKGKTPRHFWEQSNLNPNRKPQKDTDALRLGKLFHDALLLPSAMDTDYHVLPPGFTRAGTKKFAVEIAEADAAIEAGLTVVTERECEFANAMADALKVDPLIGPLLAAGEPEVTLVWQDERTGVWLRARPDWIVPDLSVGLNVKTAADASWSGFSRAIGQQGYAQGAALELAGYRAVFGERPPRYFHPVIEKPALGDWEPGDYLATALWQLPEEDIERGDFLNRAGIDLFADCLSQGAWPGYTPEPEPCGMPSYLRHVIDNGGAGEPDDDEINA